MTTLLYKALILQREIWCWSLLGLKGVIDRVPGDNWDFYTLLVVLDSTPLSREEVIANQAEKRAGRGW